MMDRALGAIATGTVAAETPEEAVKRFGMLYQWGRKDPFTPATSTGYVNSWTVQEVQIYNANGTAITKGTNGIATIEKLSEFKYEARTTTNQTTINHLIQNPSTHYHKGDGTNEVPIASTTDLTKDWWNPTIKTIYDPCPNGYRIPKSGTYDGFPKPPVWSTDLTNGMTWQRDKASFFPACGRRVSSSGQLSEIGSGSFYWMSTPYNAIYCYNLIFRSNTIIPNYSHHARSLPFTTRCIKE